MDSTPFERWRRTLLASPFLTSDSLGARDFEFEEMLLRDMPRTTVRDPISPDRAKLLKPRAIMPKPSDSIGERIGRSTVDDQATTRDGFWKAACTENYGYKPACHSLDRHKPKGFLADRRHDEKLVPSEFLSKAVPRFYSGKRDLILQS
jgi:hypothetical protein